MSSILAIESAKGPCSAALRDASGRIHLQQEGRPQRQAAQLVPLIEQVMQDAGRDYSQLDGIACSIGPGSFTAIRIGLATARGLALATGLPLIGFGNMMLQAFHALPKLPSGITSLVIIEDARRDECYIQTFQAQPFKAINAAQLLPVATIAEQIQPGLNVAFCGHLPDSLIEAVEKAGLPHIPLTHAQADEMLRLQEAFPEHNDGSDPLYIRSPDAKKPAPLFYSTQAAP